MAELSFEEFANIIDILRDRDAACSEINAVAKKYENLFSDFGPSLPMDCMDTIIVGLIEKLMDIPTYDGQASTLAWWIWEMDFGRDFKPGDLVVRGKSEKDDIKPDLSTTRGLYDYLRWEAELAKTQKCEAVPPAGK